MTTPRRKDKTVFSLGLLLAPYSGDDLQAELRARVERIQLEMKTAAQSRREELEAQLEALRAPPPPAPPTGQDPV